MTIVRKINGRVVSEAEWAERESRTAEIVKHQQVPAMSAKDMGWENENGGRGRYISQLQEKPGKRDPNAYCRSRGEIIEKAKRAGFQTISND